jgi:hypothetical protein
MPHRRAVSKGNGRLDHGEAPGMTRICRKTPVIPETVLWAALRDAGPEGVTVAELVTATGKGRTWVYDRLREWAAAGRVIQTIRGYWRAAGPGDGQASG